MDFKFSDDQEEIRRSVNKLMERFPPEYWREKDETQEYPNEFLDELGSGGWTGILIPEEYGGSGLGLFELALVVEGTSSAGAGAIPGFIFTNMVFGTTCLIKYGTEPQKREYLTKMAEGNLMASLAMTEPDAGSNTFDISTFAKREGDSYAINGQKIFISFIDKAGAAIIVARTAAKDSGNKKTECLSLFITDLPNQSVTISNIDKLGMRCTKTNSVFFDDLLLQSNSLIGKEGNGWYQLLDTLNPERIVVAAGAIGVTDLVLNLASQYANERIVFGRPIGMNQGIQFPLARLKAEMEAAKLLTYKAALLYDQGLPCGAEAEMAKFLAAEVAAKATDQAMQTFGGYGYAKEYHIERYWRDARLYRLGPISQEMSLLSWTESCGSSHPRSPFAGGPCPIPAAVPKSCHI